MVTENAYDPNSTCCYTAFLAVNILCWLLKRLIPALFWCIFLSCGWSGYSVKDILIKMWPTVLDFDICGWFRTGVTLSRTSTIGENSVLGKGTEVGEGSVIKRSVIGRGCHIGKNVLIEGCHIWDNVTIEDDAQLHYAVVCDCATVKTGAVREPGVVLSFNVGPLYLFMPRWCMV